MVCCIDVQAIATPAAMKARIGRGSSRRSRMLFTRPAVADPAPNASGSRQAPWLGGMTPVFERDGTQRMMAPGRPEIRTVLFPKSSAVITDIWQVAGLRGTGSDRLAITNLFVPDAYTFTRDRAGWREPGTL